MGQPGTSKILALCARHPGLVEKVDAMFDAFKTIQGVKAVLQSEYGEHMSHTTICNYKRRFWRARRERELAAQAAMTAYQELVSEGRN